MGLNFNSELDRIKEIQSYNVERASKMLDDLSTAYISASEHGGLDKSLIAVRTFKKLLRSHGFTIADINDFLIEKSYISKRRIRDLKTESIFQSDSQSIRPEIMAIKTEYTPDNNNTVDLIISELKSKPVLLEALKKNCSIQYLSHDLNISQPTALKKFYEQYKDII